MSKEYKSTEYLISTINKTELERAVNNMLSRCLYSLIKENRTLKLTVKRLEKILSVTEKADS